MKYIVEIYERGKCIKTILAEGNIVELVSQLSNEYPGVFKFYRNYYGIELEKQLEPVQ